MDFKAIETKWQKIWTDEKTFQPEVDANKPKFLCTFPYPYVNGLPHVGHMFSIMRTEAFGRYKRGQGFNVLFPQGWHCTGSPIVNAAKRVAEGDAKQISILAEFGVPADEVHQFTNPLHWITYFAPRYKADLQAIGLSIDWRREFITTDLNKHYDAFIRWQFIKLKEKGYVAIGKHPVVWCPKEHAPISDHSRLSGEGETPQEFTLILFTLENNEKIAVATLRPETIDGVTNIWAHPALEYVKAKVDDHVWIVSKTCIEKLEQQERTVHVLGPVAGKDLIGKEVVSPRGKTIPILPATFVSADKGTGLVMSVPSDAPDDYIALRDLQSNAKLLEQYKLHISDIKPIPIIDAGELGHQAAVRVVEDMKIQHQNERDKLEAAKKLVYKKGYYEGVMLSGPHKGEKVEVAKEKIKLALIEEGHAQKFYELTGPVVCRCLTPCIAKIVSNQWFIRYSDPEWKALAHAALDKMTLYPEKSRQQFDYVIDWLNDWACTREEGLGTRLPWDEHWLIESLSDSTLYNAYYTFSHIIKDMPIHQVTPELFDYVLLGKGDAKHAEWKTMRELFLYWYPVDFRNSGKDLIQNHLTFMIFNHVAIFGEEHWPKGYGANGWVTVDGKKMSKSLGNLIPVRAMVPLYGADACRLTILNGGEGMDDPNWDSELAKATQLRLQQFLELVNTYGTGRENRQPLDDWFESKLNTTIKKTTEAMEKANFRSAIQYAWFELTGIIKQYLKLTGGEPNKFVMQTALETQIGMLQPFAPHTAEEAWQRIGKTSRVASSSWPCYDENKIRPDLEESQDLIESLTSDIRNVQQLLKLEKSSAITVIVAAQWKYGFATAVKEQLLETRNPGDIIRAILPQYKEHAAEVTKLIPSLVADPSKLASTISSQQRELANMHAASDYLQKTFGGHIIIEAAEHSAEKKASAAFPGRPAIVLK